MSRPRTDSVAHILAFLVLGLLAVSPARAAPVIFLPTASNDEELSGLAEKLSVKLNASVIKAGDKKNLGGLDPSDRIYILVHGHQTQPLFVSSSNAKVPGKWTPEQMAKLVEKEGLSKKQKDIYLLVCYAGVSIGDKETVAKVGALQKRCDAAKEKDDKAALAKVKTEYDALRKGMAPGGKYDSTSGKLELPLSAQFASELKKAKYTNFRVISYDGAIAQYDIGALAKVVVDVVGPDGKRTSKLVQDLNPKGEWTWQEEMKLLSHRNADGTPIWRTVWQ